MSTQFVIPAYPYNQYQNDDNIVAFFSAYNAYTQAYLNALNALNLPIYTQLNGALLDWVAQGLYGISRPSLPTTGSAERGAYDTAPYNSLAYNQRIPARSTAYFATSDDIFKRIITWFFYKGDGKVFSVRWLKRRVARFLYGLNGTDYDGPTYDISVALSGYDVTITLQPSAIATVFASAIAAGVLSMPFQLTVSVVT